MDYSDLNRKYRQTDARIGGLEAIDRFYNVTIEQVNGAGADAGIKYPSDDVWTYYFVAQCLNSARSLVDDLRDGTISTKDDFEEVIDQKADSCVPYQTYVIWMVWVECGYDVDPDEIPFYGANPFDDYDIESDLYKIPQAWLYYRARDIIRNYVDDETS